MTNFKLEEFSLKKNCFYAVILSALVLTHNAVAQPYNFTDLGRTDLRTEETFQVHGYRQQAQTIRSDLSSMEASKEEQRQRNRASGGGSLPSSSSSSSSAQTANKSGVASIKTFGRLNRPNNPTGYEVRCHSGRTEMLFQNGDWFFTHPVTATFVAKGNVSLNDAAVTLCR